MVGPQGQTVVSEAIGPQPQIAPKKRCLVLLRQGGMRRRMPQRMMEAGMAHAQRNNQHQDRQVHATGGASHFAAVPPDRNAEPVREFPRFTVDINAIAGGQWLQ